MMVLNVGLDIWGRKIIWNLLTRNNGCRLVLGELRMLFKYTLSLIDGRVEKKFVQVFW